MGKRNLVGVSTYLSVNENTKLQSLAKKNKLTISNYVRKRLGFELLERGRISGNKKNSIKEIKNSCAQQISLFDEAATSQTEIIKPLT